MESTAPTQATNTFYATLIQVFVIEGDKVGQIECVGVQVESEGLWCRKPGEPTMKLFIPMHRVWEVIYP